MKTGRIGRHFSRLTLASAARTSARREAISGRLIHGDPHQVFERLVGIDQGDLKVIVLHRDNDRAGVKPEDLGEVGTVKAPHFAGGGGLLLQVGEHVPCPIDLVSGDQVFAHLQDPLDQVVAALDGVEGAGYTFPGTGVPGSRCRPSETRRHSSRSGCRIGGN